MLELLQTLRQKQRYAQEHGGVWHDQVKELKQMIHAQLKQIKESKKSMSCNVTEVQEGDIVFTPKGNPMIVKSISETPKQRHFYGYEMNKGMTFSKRNKSTHILYWEVN